MSAAEERQAALIPVRSLALTKAGAKSLAARGHADLRTKEEAEGWLKKGLEYHLQQRYDDAFRCYKHGIQVSPNHSGLQLYIGLMYHEGQGVPQDHAQAAVWYRKAAEQGDARAQLFLGYAYDHGEGIPQDYAQAAVWVHKAAKQG